jgi:hypothetical protein
MSEQVFNVVQLGRQSAVGTSVAATTVFPVDAGFLGFELDRASESPNEDFGSPSREMAGRSSTGVRWATASLPVVCRFQDIMHLLEMHVDTLTIPSGTSITLATSAAADDIIDTTGAHGLSAGDRVVFSALTGGTGLTINTTYYVSTTSGGAAVDFSSDITAGTALKGPYSYVYAFDQASNLLSTALKPYTFEYGDPASTQDEWEATGVLATDLELGFDALSAPGNSMWQATASLIALNRAPAAMTGSLAAPATLETMEGHLTTLAEGATGTAFASLSALTSSLKQFSMRSSVSAIGRAYGGSSDVASAVGRSDKATVKFDALVAISATSDTDILDIFEVAGSIPTERRWRVAIDGTGNNLATIDARVKFNAVDIGEHEGERLYAIKDGDFIYDSTLASHGTITVTNDIAAHA